MLKAEKVTHLSHVLLKGLLDKNLITLKDEEGNVRRAIKHVIASELKIGEDMDKLVRRKLESFSRKLPEGSPEWEVLYKKFMREEEIKKGR
ncbi:MAG: DUF507 family protein [Nitrospirae bacterium]|nr:DUF507 family protein [Nitrospirota bacterium]